MTSQKSLRRLRSVCTVLFLFLLILSGHETLLKSDKSLRAALKKVSDKSCKNIDNWRKRRAIAVFKALDQWKSFRSNNVPFKNRLVFVHRLLYNLELYNYSTPHVKTKAFRLILFSDSYNMVTFFKSGV